MKVYNIRLATIFVLAGLFCSRPEVTAEVDLAIFNRDLALLTTFRKTFSNENDLLQSWQGGNPCKGWLGVKCNSKNRIVSIKLSNLGLQGILKPWDLPRSLRVLDVSNNIIVGTISGSWKLFNSLRVLSLAGNRLVGFIPPTLQLPPAMRQLSLANNQLRGEIPPRWKLPQGRLTIDLSRNRLAGTLPSWPQYRRLTVRIQPGNARLCGKVPRFPKYVDQSRRRVAAKKCRPPTDAQLLLDIRFTFDQRSRKKLQAWRGSKVCRWKGVTCNSQGRVNKLDLSSTWTLRGTIPPSGWALPPTLTDLSIQADIQGTFPRKWRLPAGLKSLSLSGTRISGSLPPYWDLPRGMEALVLTGNQLTGSPPRLPHLPNMTHINLWDNKLGSTIPNSWDLPPNLTVLDLSFNRLKGPFPSNWTLPPKLDSLYLQGNRLSGTIPTTWAPDVYQLYLSGNRLSLPQEGWDMRNKGGPYYLHLDNNGMTGSLGRLMPSTQTGFLFLARNNFSGKLPRAAHVTPSPCYACLLALPQPGGRSPTARHFSKQGHHLTPHTVHRPHMKQNSLRGTPPPQPVPHAFAGSLPNWGYMDNAIDTLDLRPGSTGLCGDVPPYSGFLWDDVKMLPPCPPP